MIDPETVARELYTTYCEAVGGKAFNGDPLPAWEEFSADPKKMTQCAAWVAAGERAINLLLHND